MENKTKFTLFALLVLLAIYSNNGYANLEQFPTTITVAVTGFTNAEKADCPGVVAKYGNGCLITTTMIYFWPRIWG